MKVVLSNPSKRLFSFQFSERREREREINTGNIFSLFLPFIEGCMGLESGTAKYKYVTVSKIWEQAN
jgi:hypothetical protein